MKHFTELRLKPDWRVLIHVVLNSLNLVLLLVKLQIHLINLSTHVFLIVSHIALVDLISIQLDQPPLDVIEMRADLINNLLQGVIPTVVQPELL